IRRIADLQRRDLDLLSWGDRRGLAIIQDNRVHMAYLAMYGSNTVNGVAQIHTDILKHDVLKDWYILHPNMFQNKTNGITQRRWLGLCNPELTEIIEKRLSDRFITPLDHLSRLKGMIENDPTLVEDFIRVKGVKKAQLSAYIAKHEGIEIPAHFVFDVQVKRMHEYKRQLLNALSIMAIYQGIREGKYENLPPTAFIFGAKAAPGYTRAKAVIRYINRISNLINNDPTVNGRLRVVFVQNYNCSYAERIIPAADISEQISPAGTEASGTGNMKLMLNGAVTLGTYDGANIEIVEKAGQENNYIFGARLEDLNRIRHDYRPLDIYNSNETLRRAIDTLTDGTLGDPDDGLIELKNALLNGCSWHQADHYFVLKDFDSYLSTKLKALMDTTDKVAFAKKCLYNTASAGPFSSDRTIAEYATDIWKV
ncbi:MAG: glycogen/starch/alpha-glucan phosphorylase, partial [Clostridia bacterium]|nr:glycogen/starch/alpha-glucan phosphorylase [Clostridia bacterium]